MPKSSTKQMPKSWWTGGSHKYTDTEAGWLFSHLKPNLLPEYKNKKAELVDRIQRAVCVLAASEQDPSWPVVKKFTLNKLKKLQNVYAEYAQLIQKIDAETIDYLDCEMAVLYRTSEFSMSKEIQKILAVNDDFLRILDLLRGQSQKKGGRIGI